MKSKKFASFAVLGIAVAGIVSVAQAADPSPVGSWFGVARPCTPNAALSAALGFVESPGTQDENLCKVACEGNIPTGVCPTSQFPVPEVTMIPTLNADGVVTAFDFAEMLDHHTVAQGNWEYQGKFKIDPDGKELRKFQASFIWFQPRPPTGGPISIYSGVIKPRFVTYFDKKNPDVMRGYIQPYFWPITDINGFTNLLAGTPFPYPDPLSEIPAVCDPTAPLAPGQPHCFGTLHFTIRRTNSH